MRTGAVLLGSESTANVGRGWGLPEAHIRVAALGQPMQFGRFTITLYPSLHAPTGFTGGDIVQPLKPPVHASEYMEVLLGIGSLGQLSDAHRQDYWREVVQASGAKRVIPIHWDDFWLPSEKSMRPLPQPLDHFDATMQFLGERGTLEQVDIRLPLPWAAMDVFSGL